MKYKYQKIFKLILNINLLVILNSCANYNKCPEHEGVNPVIDSKNCHVQIKNSYRLNRSEIENSYKLLTEEEPR